jgi:hypothetical protein
LSIGDTATFCQVCGTPVEPAAMSLAVEPATAAPVIEPAPAVEPALAAEPEAAVLSPADDVLSPAEDAPDDALSRRMGEVVRLLQDASGCESTDPARAADLYRDAICRCLEATDDPLDCEDVRRNLLRGFDRLSSMLQREGLPAEALDVADSAASLGLLDGGPDADGEQLEALKDRRESLRHILHGDSAQL